MTKCIFSSIISVIFFRFCAVSFLKPFIKNTFGSINLPSYALSILFSIIIIFCLRKSNWKIPRYVIQAGTVLVLVFLLISYIQERNNSYYNINRSIESEIPQVYLAIAAALLSVPVYFFYKKHSETANKTGSKFFYKTCFVFELISSFFLVGLSVYSQYANINFLNRYDYYHLHAYTNSIFNIYWGQPYTEIITSCYGHYAFLYYPFLKIANKIGLDYLLKNYMLISAALVGITLVIWIIVLHMNTKNPLLRIFGIFMLCHFNSSRITGLYHQLYPHRTFPIAAAMLLITLWYKSRRKNFVMILGYITAVILIIWSTEMGIITSISWAALHICSIVQTKFTKSNYFRKLSQIMLHITAIPMTFFAALLLCGFLNCQFGGEMISVKDFLYPLTNQTFTALLEFELDPNPSAWMSVTALLLAFLCYGLKDTIISTSDCKKSNQTAVCFAFSVLGLGSLTYAVNRPAYNNFFIILQTAAFLITITADSFSRFPVNFSSDKNDPENLLKFNLGFICSAVLFITSISTLINIPYKLRHDAYYKDTRQISAICDWLRPYKEKNAVPVSSPIALVYSFLGWDPGIYYMDISDIIFDEKQSASFTETLAGLENNYVISTTDMEFDYPERFLETHQLIPIHINNTGIVLFEPL